MDLPQLKSLAERVRALLQQHRASVGYSQSLDLIAAVPGLRNWPEVVAFPDRVAASVLNDAAARRLAFRLNKKYQVSLTPEAVLAAVDTQSATNPRTPEIWPTGPAPGVYVTTSQAAINSLLARYEDATDGEIIYAEKAGSHWKGSVDLGEGGLWTLDRVLSGTLVVVGPLELDQQSWEDSGRHLEMACLTALVSGHRVAVLVDSETPEAICEDVYLLVDSTQPEGEDYETALLGVVTEDGRLENRDPFARPRPRPLAIKSVATIDAIPPSARAPLQQALKGRTSGILLVGSSTFDDHVGIDLVASSLALTEDAGPAARIMPRHRGTPSKDWLVPEAIKQLPFLPSIESAYDQGYRRMVFTGGYTRAESLLEFGSDVLFIGGDYGSQVDDIFMRTAIRSRQQEANLLSLTLAILGTKHIPGRRGDAVVSDLYIAQDGAKPAESACYAEIQEFIREHRTLRWQDEMTRLLDGGAITLSAIKKAEVQGESIGEFLKQRTKAKTARS